MTDDNNPQLALIALSKAATPGPWEVLLPCAGERSTSFGGIHIRSDNDGEIVASVSDVGVANLIVALVNHFRATQSRPEAELPEVTVDWRTILGAELKCQQDHHSECYVAWSAGSLAHRDECRMTEGVIQGIEYCIARLDEADAALQAAYGQQCAAARPSEVADSQLASDARYVWQMMCAIVENDPSVDRIKARDTALSIFDRLSAIRHSDGGSDGRNDAIARCIPTQGAKP